MTRQLTIALTITVASIFAASHVQAECGSHGCHNQYGQYSARQAFVLFQQNPQMIQRFPQIARELETQFGTIQPAAALTPAVVTPAPADVSAATPAAAPAQIPSAVETPAVVTQTPAIEVAPLETAPAEIAPVETPVENVAPIEADANPDAPPFDLPLEEPPVNV